MTMVRSEAVQRMALAAREKALFPSLLVAPAFSLRQSSLNAVTRGLDASRTSSMGDELLTAKGVPPPSCLGTSAPGSSAAPKTAGNVEVVRTSRRVCDTRWTILITTPCSTCRKTKRDYPECVSLLLMFDWVCKRECTLLVGSSSVGSEVLHASGCLRYRVSLLVFWGFFLLFYVRGRVHERFFCAEVFCLSWGGCALPDEYVTGFFCLLSSLWKQLKSQYGGARVGYFDTFSTCMDPGFFLTSIFC